MAKIVLAHGILGFGSVLPMQPIDYFNGVRRLYSSLGHDVLCPSVPTLGSLNVRARALESQIQTKWRDDGEPIFLLAHSMGGLDCRRMLAQNAALAGRVRRLVTVATPHWGSPVADVMLNAALPGHTPPLHWLTSTVTENAGALQDLKTRTTLQDHDVEGVEYLCIGCDTTNLLPKSPLFSFTAALGGFATTENDGVVSLASASKSNRSADLHVVWQVDHGGAIGWPSGGMVWQIAMAANAPPGDHVKRYTDLLEVLIAG